MNEYMFGLYSAKKKYFFSLFFNKYLCKSYRDNYENRTYLKFRAKQLRISTKNETYSILNFQVYSQEVGPGILEISAEPEPTHSRML